MKGFISIILGLIIIGISYLMIKREISKGVISANSKYSHISDANTKQILQDLDSVEDTVNELNRSFYEVASDLEGKYSIHEKEIELINEGFKGFSSVVNGKLKELESKINSQSSMIKSLELDNKKVIEAKPSTKETNLNSIEYELDKSSTLISKNRVEDNGENKTFDNNKTININSSAEKSQDLANNSAKVTSESSGAYIENLNDLEKEKLRDKIIELRQQGYSLNQIAKKLGVGVGELQLVLNLQRK